MSVIPTPPLEFILVSNRGLEPIIRQWQWQRPKLRIVCLQCALSVIPKAIDKLQASLRKLKRTAHDLLLIVETVPVL